MATDNPIVWPFSTTLVTEWPGERPPGWAYHVGTDFGVAQGTPVRATVSGTVYLTWNDGFGAYVLDIVRPDGLVVRNGHLSRMDVAHGSWVNLGDHIGLSGGALGTPGAGLSTGAHLHWELRWNRNWSGPGWIDPRSLNIGTFDGGASKPAEPETPPEEIEDDMPKNTGLFYQDVKTNKIWYVVANTGSGFYKETTDGRANTTIPVDLLKRWTAGYELSGGGFFKTTMYEANDLRKSCEDVRKGK